jgi:hypothetical protein
VRQVWRVEEHPLRFAASAEHRTIARLIGVQHRWTACMNAARITRHEWRAA